MIPPSNVPVPAAADKTSEGYDGPVQYMHPADFVDYARELGASEAEINEKLGRPVAVEQIAGLNRRERTAISLPAHAYMPGRNRAERRFALHCARRALRGTLSTFKREKLERLTYDQARSTRLW